MTDAHTVLTALAARLSKQNYTFVCPTPDSQARVVQSRSRDLSTRYSTNLEDFFGWSLPAEENTLSHLLSPELVTQLRESSIISADKDDILKANFRFSSFYLPHVGNSETKIDRFYYVHSPFPTNEDDAVFFGPDSYFFVDFLSRASRHLSHKSLSAIVDVCCGSGAGAIHMSRTYPNSKVLGLDLNPKALKLGRVNAMLANCHVDFAESDLFSAVPSTATIDLIVSNPPYIASSGGGDVPLYAAGGAQHGLALPLRIVEEGIKVLATRGLLVIYTGVPISIQKPGQDPFLERLQEIETAELVEYRIIHPDMWPEEVGKGAYTEVGRIQVVGAVLSKSG